MYAVKYYDSNDYYHSNSLVCYIQELEDACQYAMDLHSQLIEDDYYPSNDFYYVTKLIPWTVTGTMPVNYYQRYRPSEVEVFTTILHDRRVRAGRKNIMLSKRQKPVDYPTPYEIIGDSIERFYQKIDARKLTAWYH